MEKVSIVVPIYNGEKYIRRCLNSLLSQTYQNLEIICVNDGSIDNSIKILNEIKKNDNRIIVIDKQNTGVSDSRNIAIKKSTGKYIAFCDIDDIYELNYIEKIVNYFKRKNVDAVRCNYKVIDENDKLISTGNLDNLNRKIFDNKSIQEKLIPMALNGTLPCFSYLIVVKKECLNNIEYPTDIRMMEDVVFYIKVLLSIKKIYVTNEQLYTIMFNNNGATNSYKNYERNIFNILCVNKYVEKILKDNNLNSESNLSELNLNHLNAISDFIFKHYLYNPNSTIDLCKKISVNKIFNTMLENVNYKSINYQRKKILVYIKNKKFIKLNIYFKLRKLIFKIRRVK